MAAGRNFRQAQEHPDEWTWLKIRAEERAGARGPAISPECGGVRQSGRNFVRDAQAMVATTGIQSGLSGGPPGGGLTDQCPHAGEFWRRRLGVVQTDGSDAHLYSKRGATKCDDFRDLSRAPAAPPASGPKPIKTALRCGAPPVRCP